jgi:hypothetical protein
MFSFAAHISLLTEFLDRRQAIVDRIESTLLNVKEKDTSRRRDRAYFDQLLTACLFGAPGLPHDLLRLKGQLAARHLADGFEPVLLERFSHQLDPLELIVRAYLYWNEQRWPGKSARLTYAHAIYAVFIVRQIEYLGLTIWDDGEDSAADRLQTIQQLLERLNQDAPVVFSRRAEWLMQTAQGPLTRHLEPYFRISERIDESLAGHQRLELHTAGARLAGGHLRSQLRYRVWTSTRPSDDPELVAFVRNANAMDTALLVHDLAALLDAYDRATDAADSTLKLDLADAILQGVSADPELFLTRLDLLGPCTAIEHLFIAGAGGHLTHTPAGQRHAHFLDRYAALVGKLAGELTQDAERLRPRDATYSPYGVAYGFCADLMQNMALSVLHGQPQNDLALEDMFVSHDRLDDKLARAQHWQRLPARAGEREHFEHSSEWASEIWTRTTAALDARAARPADPNASPIRSARVFVVVESPDTGEADVSPDAVPAQEYCFTSDLKRAVDTSATPQPKHQMMSDRNEGRFLASVETNDKWFAVSKLILSMFTSQGKEAVIRDVPPAAVEVLQLTAPAVVSVIDRSGAHRSDRAARHSGM